MSAETVELSMTRLSPWMIASAAVLLIAADAPPPQQIAYPSKGQSAEQQAKDETECGQWAVEKSGFDPAKPPAQANVQPAPVTGSGARVKGAAAGATVAAVSGGDAGAGAAAGAVAGGVVRRHRNRKAAAAQQQAIAQQTQAGNAAYLQARSACLTGRGYTVK